MRADDYWDKATRDRWFYLFLGLSCLGVAWIFWPYVYDILFATVFCVVSWPLYSWILRICRGRRGPAAMITTVIMAVIVFGPLGYLGYWFYVEVRAIVDQVGLWVTDVDKEWLSEQFYAWIAYIGEYSPEAQKWIEDQLWTTDNPELGGPVDLVAGWVVSLVQEFAAFVPGVLASVAGSVFSYSIHAIIFLFAVISLYIEGPTVLQVLKNLSPMDDDYEDRLFGVFSEISFNLVVGSVATAGIQGLVAAFGYWLVGVDKVVFLSICTAVFSFMPVVGTLIIWLPVTLYLGFSGHWGAAAFLGIYSIVITGTVDNVLRPFFVRGSTDIHPFLVFLAVFGGMYWLNVPGALIGPLVVAFFLALYNVYVEDFLQEEREPPPPPGPTLWARLSRVTRFLTGKRTPVADDPAEPEPAQVG